MNWKDHATVSLHVDKRATKHTELCIFGLKKKEIEKLSPRLLGITEDEMGSHRRLIIDGLLEIQFFGDYEFDEKYLGRKNAL